jgi:hypothetical protein
MQMEKDLVQEPDVQVRVVHHPHGSF